jgi:hypothetical protein
MFVDVLLCALGAGLGLLCWRLAPRDPPSFEGTLGGLLALVFALAALAHVFVGALRLTGRRAHGSDQTDDMEEDELAAHQTRGTRR